MIPRVLHCSSGHPFSPLMFCINEYIKRKLRDMRHILKDSIHLVHELALIEADAADPILKCDFKDFFMSGDHASDDSTDLASLGSKAFPARLKSVAHDSIAHILNSQYVSVDPGDGKEFVENSEDYFGVYKVVKGSGMGMKLSGSVSDMAFYELVETWVLDASTRRVFGI